MGHACRRLCLDHRLFLTWKQTFFGPSSKKTENRFLNKPREAQRSFHGIYLFFFTFDSQLQRKRRSPVTAHQTKATPAGEWSRWLGGVSDRSRQLLAPQTAGAGHAVLPALPAGCYLVFISVADSGVVACSSLVWMYCSPCPWVYSERKDPIKPHGHKTGIAPVCLASVYVHRGENHLNQSRSRRVHHYLPHPACTFVCDTCGSKFR